MLLLQILHAHFIISFISCQGMIYLYGSYYILIDNASAA